MFTLYIALALATDGPPAGWTELQPEPLPPAAADPLPPADGASTEPPAEGEDVDAVVLVIGEHVIAERRADLVRAMERLGWRGRERTDGSVRFKAPETWMGRARLYPSGDIEFLYNAVTGNPTGVAAPYNAFSGIDSTKPIEPSFGATLGSPSKRKVEAVQKEVRAEIQPFVIAYREAIQGRAVGALLEELPNRLDRLWSEGVDLDGTRLETIPERRAALLDYWATRTDTPEGRAVLRRLEAFLRNVVQGSEHPFTDDELLAAEARRADGRRLEL